MKKILKSFAYLFVMLILLASCVESAIDPLTGRYQAPESYTLTNLFSQSMEKQNKGLRTFTLKMATDGVTALFNEASSTYTFNGTGNYFSIDFVGKEYYLTEGTYAIAASASKAGTYLAGNDANSGSYFFTINNGIATGLAVKGGNISVTKTDNHYTISGTLTLADESVIRVAYDGTIVYEPDPEPLKPIELTNVFAAMAQVQTAGHQLITLKISTSDVAASYNAATYSYTYTGTGNYISIDLLSNDATIEPGTYSAADNGATAVGNFVKGYDTEMWGMKFYNWGSCWFNVENGTESGQKIVDGSIVVAKNGSTYTITITGKTSGGDDVYAEYKGQIAQLNSEPEEPEVLYTYTNKTSAVTTYDFATGVTTTYEGVTMNTITVFDAEGNTVAAFEAVTTSDATTLAGEYTIAESPTLAGQMNNGWSVPDWNMSGGSYFIEEGVKWYIKGGTVTIIESSDGSLKIAGSELTLQDDASTSKTGGFSLTNIAK